MEENNEHTIINEENNINSDSNSVFEESVPAMNIPIRDEGVVVTNPDIMVHPVTIAEGEEFLQEPEEGTEIDDQEVPFVEEDDLNNLSDDKLLTKSKISTDNFVSDNNLRFRGAPWYPAVKDTMVTIGGVGGIGSYLTFYLSRMGVWCRILDPDIVDSVNFAGQLFSVDSMSIPKVTAIMRTINKLCINPFRGEAIQSSLDFESALTPITFSCFDSIDARKVVFTRWRELHDNNPKAIFIDGRLAAEAYQIFCIPGNNKPYQELYNTKYLFDASEVTEQICSYKQTSHMAGMIAAKMVMYFTNHIYNRIPENLSNGLMRPIPFLDELDNEDFYNKITM